jgi:2-C-methyl-D-erythritol 4-phosphate cytidylyltransferase
MNIGVILAGGKGLRMGGTVPKQILPLGHKPVIAWSVDTFHKTGEIDKIIIVSEKNLLSRMKEFFPSENYPKILSFIEGGDERSDSSYNAIISGNFGDDDIFLFHDAARPFVTMEIITGMINKVRETGACGTYIPSSDTIAIIKNSFIDSIPERREVFAAQTPQGFRYGIIKQAHELQKKVKNHGITDDVSLVINMGKSVSVTDGSPLNIKITTDTDLKFAEYLVRGGFVC